MHIQLLKIFRLNVLALSLFVISCDSQSSSDEGALDGSNYKGPYVGNQRTKVFHIPNCRFVPDIIDKTYFDTRQQAIDSSYTADKSTSGCKP